MLCCLNLHPELRFLPAYTFYAGITPGPHEPTAVTISKILEPLVDELEALFLNGTDVVTPRAPDGRCIRAIVWPFIADLVALRKSAGFVSHNGRKFCSFCEATKKQLAALRSFPWRTSENTTEAGREWLTASSEKGS